MTDDSVTVQMEIDQDLLDAMRRVRDNQRADRRTQRAELSDETPATIVSNLLRNAYSAELRRAKTRDEGTRLGEKWR